MPWAACSARSSSALGRGEIAESRLVRPDAGQVHMDADEPLGPLPAEAVGDRCPPVAALRPVAVIAEGRHEFVPRPGDPFDGPAGARRLVTPAESREGRRHHVKGVGRVAAVGPRVGERPQHPQELDDRARPAVGEHERQCVGRGRADVQEVDAEVVEHGPELRERVDAVGEAEVVVVGPVRAQISGVGERDALAPVVDGLALGPTGVDEPLAQVGDRCVVDADLERFERLGHRRRWSQARVRPATARCVRQARRRSTT